MELSDLNIFRTVVKAGGVRRAAAQLHRVQSNVTTRVRQLEEELGVALFIREGRGLQVSPAGRVLLDYADRILALTQEAREALHDETPRGVLRLGAMESTAAVRLPGPITEYHRRYPDVTIELKTGNPVQLSTALLNGELDAALVAEPVLESSFEKVSVYDEELVIVSEAHHPPIKSARDLKTRTILVFESGCPHRKRLEDWFRRNRHIPERTIEMSSYHALLGCAVAGMGVALLPRSVIDGFPERRKLSIHKLPVAHATVRTMMIWRKNAQPPKLRALTETILSHGQSSRRGAAAKKTRDR